MKIIAIDPGNSGGIAWINDNTEGCCNMPETEGDIVAKINELVAMGCTTCYMEEVGGYTGGMGAPGSAMFNFGRNFGFLLGVLAARGVRLELVRPQKWQKEFSLGTVKSSGGKGPWKRKLKEKAQQLYPHLTVTLKTADALLILKYATCQL